MRVRSPTSAAADAADSAQESWRIALVTGYYKEDRALLERCLTSVRRQTVAVDHLVVSDGLPQAWLDAEPVRHIKLDRPHGDYGNTPRGIGALLAVAEDYDAIGFIDADNWLEPDHVRHCLTAARGDDGTLCDYVVAQRNLRRPDETIIEVADEPIMRHVDTNCFFFLPGSYHAMQTFALIPRQLSAVGDRVFYTYLTGQKFLTSRIVPTKTVNYHCLWASVYANAAETPPPGAKPNIDTGPINRWLASLSAAERVLLTRRTGLKIA